ncbi:pyridoxal-phosphate-dependent aminotransferase family protein [Desertibaculum subflavum]|uniref:pyridoxal-phosphate-dependent aminotransferase family protein n=1 Tax=Desertibaculum subflavum TaxID=2268458 RepID=UPI000E65ED19
MSVLRGRQFFMHPGPTNIPDRVLRAMDRPASDFMGKDFLEMRFRCADRVRAILKSKEAVVVFYASSGHGAWEAAVANTLSPGDKVLVCQSGYFSENWAIMAKAFGAEVETLTTPDRKAVDPKAVEARLAKDDAREIKAVLVVHNETSTGTKHPVAEIRAAIDRAGHSALFMVDTISSLVSFDFRMDEWKVDVVVGGSQKGLMLPPGMSFTGVSEKAWNASQSARNPRRYWDWRNLVENKRQARFCGTAPIHFFFGLEASLAMIEEEGLENIFIRHRRLADATRACVNAWSAGGGPEVYPVDAAAASDSLTAVLMPKGHNAEDVRRIAEGRFNVALGRGLGALDGRVFRIGHMGDLNEPTMLGALSAVEMALKVAKVPHGKGGLDAAMAVLAA